MTSVHVNTDKRRREARQRGSESLSGNTRPRDKPVVEKTRQGWGRRIPDVALSSQSAAGSV